jgi:hypothetical protein
MVKKILLLFRYMFFIPLSFVISFLMSGLISLAQNLFCKFPILKIYGICENTGAVMSRTFLAEIAGVIIFFESCKLILPKHKNTITAITAVIAFIIYSIVIVYAFLVKQILPLEIYISCIICFIYFLYLFKRLKDN